MDRLSYTILIVYIPIYWLTSLQVTIQRWKRGGKGKDNTQIRKK